MAPGPAQLRGPRRGGSGPGLVAFVAHRPELSPWGGARAPAGSDRPSAGSEDVRLVDTARPGRDSVPTIERTICQQNAPAVLVDEDPVRGRVHPDGDPPTNPLFPRHRPRSAPAEGAEVVLPMNGSPRGGAGPDRAARGPTMRTGARNGSGGRSVDDRVAVGTPARGRRASNPSSTTSQNERRSRRRDAVHHPATWSGIGVRSAAG